MKRETWAVILAAVCVTLSGFFCMLAFPGRPVISAVPAAPIVAPMHAESDPVAGHLDAGSVALVLCPRMEPLKCVIHRDDLPEGQQNVEQEVVAGVQVEVLEDVGVAPDRKVSVVLLETKGAGWTIGVKRSQLRPAPGLVARMPEGARGR